MPLVTVVVATYRPGGFALPIRGLAHQTFKDFNCICIEECEKNNALREVYLNETWAKWVETKEINPLPFHAPTVAMNAGCDLANGEYIALLADYAYPHPHWLDELVRTLEETRAPAVHGFKCIHGVAKNILETSPKPATCVKPLYPETYSPIEAIQAPAIQRGYTLGNLIFRRTDFAAVNGLEERFAGQHGYEDENFVRRLTALTRRQPWMTKKAVIHQYWPYSNGFKPLVPVAHRRWAYGQDNNALGQLITDLETVVGNYRAQRVGMPLREISEADVYPREAAPAPEAE